MRRGILISRLLKKIEPTPSCWVWRGTIGKDGYGRVERRSASGKRVRIGAHRAVYEAYYGAIPSGMFVMHSCDNPGCVNPWHLSVGTPAENHDDMKAKGRGVAGEKNGRSKLSSGQVLDILQDGRPLSLVAKQYGVTKQAVALIRQRKNWRHLH